jgi:hypothetical protein
MIDFEQEIEERLRHFQWLNGKGNVKDCNHTLYEIIRLMLGMISQNSQQPTVEPESVTADVAVFAVQNSGAPTSEQTEITNETLLYPTTVKTINAPFGLTKFGNPKRDRSNHKK